MAGAVQQTIRAPPVRATGAGHPHTDHYGGQSHRDPHPAHAAPQEDRVGFPAGYGETFRLLVVFDRPDNKQVRALCANELAAGIAPGKSFPYGSVLVMETWRAKLDHNGNPV